MMACLLLFLRQEVSASDRDKDMIRVSVDYTYYAPPSAGEDEAKVNALKRAKLQAVEDHFGTTVQQNNSTLVIADGNNSDVKFTSQAESEVRGEWVQTIGVPEYKVWYDGGLVVNVRVKGLISPIDETQTDLDIKVLCNGVSDKFERTEFHDGDDLFVRVTSSVDGFIAVYLSDMNNVYCLLPYPDDDGHASFIRGGVARTLFSYDHNDADESVKQYHLTCEQGVEVNMLYVIFSVKNFDKAVDDMADTLLPRQLPDERFRKWLSSCKRRDRQFQIREFALRSYEKSVIYWK